MKWQSPSDRTVMIVFSPIIVPLAAMAIPIVGLMVGLQKVREWLCPQRDWHLWFAWRPVHAYHDPASLYRSWVWLEPVRRAGSCAYGWTYRLATHPPAPDARLQGEGL